MKKKTSEECDDKNCPVHGGLKTRGRVFVGPVISAKMQKTAIVEWKRRNYLPKYERFEEKLSKVKVHNPPCINAKEGDLVKIMETRPLSKAKSFVVIEILGQEKGFKGRMQGREESKVKDKLKEEAKKPSEEESKEKPGETKEDETSKSEDN